MSAVPKPSDPAFWTKARTAEIYFPQGFERVEKKPEEKPKSDAIPSIRIEAIPFLQRIVRFMAGMIIISLFIMVSSVSLQGLKAMIDARDTRIAIQTTINEIGMLREELQQARASLETYDSPEGFRTLPIDPREVPSVELPPHLR